MNRRLAGCLSPLVLTAMIGCAAQKVQTDFDDDVDFSALTSYAWIESDRSDLAAGGLDATAIDGMIRHAVDRQLAAKGCAVAGEGRPADFHIMHHASVERKVQVLSIQMPPPSGDLNRWFYRPPPPPAYRGTSSTEMYEYDAGTLVLTMLDPTTQRPIWQGRTESAVVRNRTDEQRRARIDEVIAALLADFPPR